MSGARANIEVRVLGSEDQDATMTEVGERVRPPGEPPDAGASYASKVVGMNGGGMPIPESLLDDAFVTERLHVEFPNGDEGEPSITIEPEVLEAMNGMWKQCMIVKVLGRNVAIAALSKKLRELWSPKGAMYVMDLPRQFFMVRFEREEEYLAALSGGPWRIFGSYLMVRAWSPVFDPLRDEIVTTPVWIRLSNIPVNFYHRSILMGIAKGLGTPIRVDLTTLNFERARFARICVEVNLAKPLKGTVLINGERYFVAYEGLSEICSKCGIYGHLIHGCPKTISERVANLALTTERMATKQIEQRQEDGFTQVRGGRRGTQTSREVNAGVGEINGGAHRSPRETPKLKAAENIVVSNKYGSLEIVTNMEESINEEVAGEGNKENQNTNIQQKQGKGTLLEKETLIFGGKKSELTISTGVRKERWGGHNKKLSEGVRGRPKQLPNRPVRGLVFGPTKGEISLSESGKRLRVESSVAGRSNGEFRDNMEVARVIEKPLRLRDEEVEDQMESNISATDQGEADVQTDLQGDGRILSLA